ncbi:MAG TPA: hypothetical protein VIL04_07255 [Solirubrobacterales bacterium]
MRRIFVAGACVLGLLSLAMPAATSAREAYVTVGDPEASRISVIDLESGEVTETVPMSFAPVDEREGVRSLRA